MKCPVCGAAYPADSKFCRVDGTPLLPVAAAAPAQAAPAVVAGGRKSSRAAIVAAAALLALAVAAGAGYFAFRSSSAEDRPGGRRLAEAAADQEGAAPATGYASERRNDAGDGEGSQREQEGSRPRERMQPEPCRKAACFEIFGAQLTPAAARPGQTVRCTARYTFRHNEGGSRPLQVEESVNPGIRFSRGKSRRVNVGRGPNFFEATFRVPENARAGTYPVTLSVRRRIITESIRLQLVVRD